MAYDIWADLGTLSNIACMKLVSTAFHQIREPYEIVGRILPGSFLKEYRAPWVFLTRCSVFILQFSFGVRMTPKYLVQEKIERV